jgi:LacI family transcriptional regulator
MKKSPDPIKSNLIRVAELAGVGIATVDRVMNERGGVSAATTAKVLTAARDLRLRRILPSPHHRTLRIAAILARPELPLIARVYAEFQTLSRTIDRSVVIHRRMLDDDTPHSFAAAILGTDCDAVIVYAPQDPEVHAAIAKVTARGVKVITIISDLPQSDRFAYAGTDQVAAGRTAAFFAHHMLGQGGKALILAGFPTVAGHQQRIAGFTGYLAEIGSNLRVVDVVYGHDQRDRSEALLRLAIKAHPDMACIFNVGAANLAVEAVIVDRAPRPMFFGFELTDNTRRMLRAGTMTLVIDQNPEQQIKYAIEILMQQFGLLDGAAMLPMGAAPTPFNIISATTLGG